MFSFVLLLTPFSLSKGKNQEWHSLRIWSRLWYMPGQGIVPPTNEKVSKFYKCHYGAERRGFFDVKK